MADTSLEQTARELVAPGKGILAADDNALLMVILMLGGALVLLLWFVATATLFFHFSNTSGYFSFKNPNSSWYS